MSRKDWETGNGRRGLLHFRLHERVKRYDIAWHGFSPLTKTLYIRLYWHGNRCTIGLQELFTRSCMLEELFA